MGTASVFGVNAVAKSASPLTNLTPPLVTFFSSCYAIIVINCVMITAFIVQSKNVGSNNFFKISLHCFKLVIILIA